MEKAINAAITAVCAFLIGTFVRNYYFSSRPNPRTQPSIQKGGVAKLPGTGPTEQPTTLVLALSKNCHFCAAKRNILRAGHKIAPNGSRVTNRFSL